MRFPKAGMTLLTAALVYLSGCDSEKDPRQSANQHMDASGRARIAVMAPAVAEMMDALDSFDQIVAVGDFVRWPVAATSLPTIGGYDKPNLELVLSLEIDLLITARSEAGQQIHQRMKDLGVNVLELDTETFEGVMESILIVGEVLDREREARILVTQIENSIEKVRNTASNAPHRRVLFVVGKRPLYVAGPGSYLDLLIEAAGGENVFSDAMSPYQLVSMEAALERVPEVIIDVSDNRPGALRGIENGYWGQWNFIPAVRNNQVFWVDPIRLTIPGPRMSDMVELMAKLIHPEIFGSVSIEELGAMSIDAR